MEKRPFGKTGHLSTVAIFGAACFSNRAQKTADRAMEMVLEAGVNTIDVAPSYGKSEIRLGPWMEKYHQHIFIACKTGERTRQKAFDELQRSLDRLRVTHFDLYQFHDVTQTGEIDKILGPDGALEAFIEARQQGLIQHIGVTGHGPNAPVIHMETILRLEQVGVQIESIMLSIFPRLYANPVYRSGIDRLLQECRKRQIAVMAINATYRSPWKEDKPRYTSWYEPFDRPDDIQECVNFTLSQDVTGCVTIGDVDLLPKNLAACENFTPIGPAEQDKLIQQHSTRDFRF